MAVTWKLSECEDFVIYNGEKGEVWININDDLAPLAFIAREFHGGQGSVYYRIQCGNDWSPETIEAAREEIIEAFRPENMSDDDATEVYEALVSARYALGKIRNRAGDWLDYDDDA